MSSVKLTIPSEFESASTDARIEYVQALWDRIAENPTSVDVPDHHKKILDERLDSAANDGGERLWSEVRDQILTELRQS